MKYLSDITTTKLPWLALSFSALALELSALFFQYGLDLEPCIMCIYQRLAIWSIFIAGGICAMYSHTLLCRIISYIFWAIGAIWGLLIAIEHHEIQTSAMSFLYTCEFVPNFPSWAPLHLWLPALFEASGDCGDIDWQFLGYTMPQVMIVVFTVYTIVLASVISNRLYHARKL